MRGMKNAVRILAVVPVFIALAGCHLIDHTPQMPLGRRHTTGRTLEQPSPGPESVLPGRVLVTGVAFPDYYDWRRDTANGKVHCSVVLIDGSQTLVSFPAGEDAQVSQEADMHRYASGGVFSDYAWPGGTVVKRDGEVIFRYDERELVSGLQVCGDDVFTLGIRPGGRGLTLRRNGIPEYSAPSGTPLGRMAGRLYYDAGALCFSYLQTSPSTKAIVVRDGVAEEIDAPYSLGRVLDVLSVGGRTVMLAFYKPARMPFLVIGDSFRPLGGSVAEISEGYLIPDGQDFYAQISYTGKDGLQRTELWTEGGSNCSPGECSGIQRYFVRGGKVAYLGGDGGTVSFAGAEGVEYAIPEGSRLMGDACAAWDGRMLCLALTPSSPLYSPLLMMGQEQLAVKINGYLTGVYIDNKEETDVNDNDNQRQVRGHTGRTGQG